MQVGRVRWDFRSAHPQVVQTKKSRKIREIQKKSLFLQLYFFPNKKIVKKTRKRFVNFEKNRFFSGEKQFLCHIDATMTSESPPSDPGEIGSINNKNNFVPANVGSPSRPPAHANFSNHHQPLLMRLKSFLTCFAPYFLSLFQLRRAVDLLDALQYHSFC